MPRLSTSLLVGVVSLILLASSSLPAYSWLSGVSWYQGPVVDEIPGMYADFVVVDPDYGPGDEPWSSGDIEWIHASGKKLIAYLNIGFAEEWRDYWNSSWSETDHPEWLEWVEYPGWPGEYFVKYWHSSAWEPGGWVDILKAEIDKIIDMGFDGVRLDNIDSYTYWEDPDSIGLGGTLPQVDNASTWMIYLVGNLSSYAKTRRPGFTVFANMGGGLELLGNDTFLSSIDVVEREEVWYSDNAPVDPAETNEALTWLRYARDHGKQVFVMDYAWSPEYVEDALQKAEDEGFYIYVAPSYDLDRIPAYLPVYRGVDADADLVVWSYHGAGWPGTSGWDVFVALFDGERFRFMTKIDEDADYEPRIAVAGDVGEALVAYMSNETTGTPHIRAAFVDAATTTVLGLETIDDGMLGDAVYSDGYYYVSYTRSGDVYVARITPGSHSIEAVVRVTDTGDSEEYPVLAPAPGGVYVAWLDGSELWLAHVSGDTVAWTATVSDGVDRLRYGIGYVEDKGVVVVYSVDGSGRAVLYQSGSPTAMLTDIPAPVWETRVAVINRTVAYIGLGAIHYLLVGSLVYSGSDELPFNTARGAALSRTGDGLLVAAASGAPNNTIYTFSTAPPQPVPEPPYTPIALAVILVAVSMMVSRRRSTRMV